MTPLRRALRVQFAHGLESSPQSRKARLFAARFDARTPAMDTSDFASCVEVHARTLREFRPDVLVGSSFGGAVVVALLARGDWTGPTLLLAPAARFFAPGAELPAGVRVLIVHATSDDIVPIAHSRALARTGTPEMVELLERDDDHALSGLTESEELARLVEQLGA